MSYRDDFDAALARSAALEQQLEQAREALAERERELAVLRPTPSQPVPAPSLLRRTSPPPIPPPRLPDPADVLAGLEDRLSAAQAGAGTLDPEPPTGLTEAEASPQIEDLMASLQGAHADLGRAIRQLTALPDAEQRLATRLISTLFSGLRDPAASDALRALADLIDRRR